MSATHAGIALPSPAMIFELDAVPSDCPWQVGTRDPARVIDEVFEPVADDLPTFVRALREACTRVVASRTDGGEWRLLYYLERRRPEAMCVRFPGGSEREVVYMGGAPAAVARLSDAARAAGWSAVPSQLARFAAVHDGFGPEGVGFGVESILPVASMEPLNDAHPEWLEVRCDSVGNRRLLLRSRSADSFTVDWDHETHEIAEEITFFHWLDEHVSCELLDLDRWDFPLGPYPPPTGATFDVGARFDAIATKPHDFALYNYYAVDFEAWRLPDVGRRAVDAVLGAAADTPPRRYLDQILSMTTLGRIRVALDHIIDAAYVADAREDDCAHSWALEALCLATGRVLNLDGLSEVLEIIDEELRCPPFVDALPFDLPASHTGTPGIAHATNASLRAHVETLDAHIEAGAFGEKENATRYREILDAVARAELGLIYIGW